MSNALQLSLFSNLEKPSLEALTIEWLFDFLKLQHPEMKFVLKKDFEGENTILQTLHKKVKLEFHLGRYSHNAVCYPNQKYIGCNLQKYFGHYEGIAESYRSLEEFEEIFPLRIESCKKSIEEYKNQYKNKKKEEWEEE